MNQPGDPPGDRTEVASASATRAEEITLVFDQATVNLDALQRSAYAVAAKMTVDIRVCGTDYACTLFPRNRSIPYDELRHLFRMEVNDQVLRVRIAKDTEGLRNLIFALAFSQTGLVEGEGSAR